MTKEEIPVIPNVQSKSIIEQCKVLDTVLNNGFFVKLELLDSIQGSYSMSWGNDDFKRKYEEATDTFYCSILFREKCDYTPIVEFVNDEFIYAKRGTDGASAGNCVPIVFEQIILPLDKTDSPNIIPLYIKMINGISISTNNYNKIILTNHEKRSIQELELSPPPIIMFKTLEYSFDTIYLSRNELIVNYFYDEDDLEKTIKRRFKIR